ncbi:PUA domain-containing protein, partial [Aeromonas veronii]|uniref:PUA domain-containing protein n=1 Tax=Aeromonas veronii TaxID=654 RepID=UPI0038B4AA70
EKGSSLLPKGIVAVTGDFIRGDVVRILDPKGAALARGICRYDHLELEKLRGVPSDQIEQVLGYGYGSVA